MKKMILTGTFLVSFILPTLTLAPKGQASPQCYGINQSGATIDLSQICSPSQQSSPDPSERPKNTETTEVKTSPESANKPPLSPEEQAKEDLNTCLASPQCSRVLGGDMGNTEPQMTPHQERMERARPGSSIR